LYRPQASPREITNPTRAINSTANHAVSIINHTSEYNFFFYEKFMSQMDKRLHE